MSATSLDVPGPVGGPDGYNAPVVAGAEAQASVSYAEGDVPIGAPEDLAFVQAYTNYDYRYFVDGGSGYAAPVLLGNTQSLDEEVMAEANFDVTVNVDAEAGAQFMGSVAGYPQTAEGGASADPTFAIDEPSYSALHDRRRACGPSPRGGGS